MRGLNEEQRNIQLAGTFNTRDFGGYPGAGGRMVKCGLLYRSDALGRLTDDDIKRLEALQIKTVVDFRGGDEAKQEPDRLPEGAAYVNLPPHAAVAQLASGNILNDKEKVDELVRLAATEEGRKQLVGRQDDMAVQMRDLVRQDIANQQYGRYLQLLLEPANTPILHHCKGGKDRAGFAAVLVLLALGVDRETIMYDYMLTRDNMAARNARRMDEYRQYTDNEFVLSYLYSLMETKESYLAAAFDEIDRMSGSDEAYLEQVLHLGADQIARLRELYLEEEETV